MLVLLELTVLMADGGVFFHPTEDKPSIIVWWGGDARIQRLGVSEVDDDMATKYTS